MNAPSDPPEPIRQPPSGVGSVEAALDETLDESFPASDAANLHQWAEMRRRGQPLADKPDAGQEKADPEGDRLERYLRGPTAFCA
jgi:hypothetical protein